MDFPNPVLITFLSSDIRRHFLSLFRSQHITMSLPDALPVFELLVLVTDEFPQLCVGVRDCSNRKPATNQQLKFDIIELNGSPISAPGRM